MEQDKGILFKSLKSNLMTDKLSENYRNNLERINEIRRENPFATHVFFRRADNVTVDVPIAQAEFNANNHKEWIVEVERTLSAFGAPASAPARETVRADIPASTGVDVEVPAKPSEEKPLCPHGFEGSCLECEAANVAPPQNNEHVVEGAEQFAAPPTPPAATPVKATKKTAKKTAAKKKAAK